MSDRRSASSSPKVSPTMIVPKREPIENDLPQCSKRRFGEHLPHETEIILPNKRQMATKKHQQTDQIQSKLTNGRNANNDEQQIQKRLDSTSPSNTSSLFPNGGINDTSSSTSNKPR